MTALPVGVPPAPPSVAGHERRGLALVVIAALTWGTMGVSVAITNSHSSMGTLDLSWLRLVTGGAALLGVAAATGRLRQLRWDAVTVRHVVTNAALAAFFTSTYFAAVTHIGVAIATVLSLGAGPVVVIMHGAASARRRPPTRDVVAVLIALVGLALVCDVAGGVEISGDLTLGVLCAVTSGCAFGWTAVVNRRRVTGLAPVTLVGAAFFLGGLFIALGMAVAGTPFVVEADPIGWASFVFVVLGPTALGYVLFHVGLQAGVPSTTASLVTLLEAVTATFLAVVVLHEQVTPSVAAGSVLVLCAVLVRDRGKP